jgi:hypothetical protein
MRNLSKVEKSTKRQKSWPLNKKLETKALRP